ncbi:endonuclease/exonuclease/phosphatase family protein [Pseudomonas sp.]|uniref:endonuclease/exonuclease/phosphatase family protein n=1 Tax=Pseudomonas sp. TaxID=306 RepID=UPI002735F651|nr:endonuclease/exonuclease/phosphatase family protein [Pseudomonas sp.]MDP2747467.1 endonuclease/exonuclease/phosphatase family protein [Pseudomonas sp.]
MATTSPPDKPNRSAFWARRVITLALLCLLGLLLPLLSHLLADSAGTLAWLIDLASHWQWLFLLGLVVFAGLACCRDKRWAVLLLALPLPWLTASAPAPTGEPQVQLFAVASANVHLDSRNTQGLATWLAQEKPDVVVLLEVSPAYAQGLRTLRDYPFQHIVAQDSPFGIAVLSRHPLQQVEVVEDAQGIAHIEAQLQWHGQPIGIIALHPMPPLSPQYHSVRNAKLAALATQAAASAIPTVLAGDLNATPWSSAFSGLAQLGLRRASGLAATWPAVLQGVLGLPIDHVLVTPHWAVAARQVGPPLGSDHLPVLVRLVPTLEK